MWYVCVVDISTLKQTKLGSTSFGQVYRRPNLQTLSNSLLGLLSTTRGIPLTPPESPKVVYLIFNTKVESPLKTHLENAKVPAFEEEQSPSDVHNQNVQIEMEATNCANEDTSAQVVELTL
jgi:hypothetical protein